MTERHLAPRLILLLGGVSLTLAGLASACKAEESVPVPIDEQANAEIGSDNFERALVVLVNDVRLRENLRSLQLDPDLVKVARQRSADMSSRGYFDHVAPTGETVFNLLSDIGYEYSIAGENIARNNYPLDQSVEIAMKGFMESPTHRDNILDGRFTRIGIGHFEGPGGLHYFTQLFASK